MKILKIGTTVYLVNKSGNKLNMKGSRVIPAKVIGYQNIGGKVFPIVSAGKIEYDLTHNDLYRDLDKAVEAIESK